MTKITVITINYNNINGLKRTIPSVLSQTYKDFEYIIIDGGSTDGSKEYIESQPSISYWVSEKDKGIYNAMNKGVRFAHGEYCIFINSGDHFFSSTSLEMACAELDDFDYCTGKCLVMDAKDSFLHSPRKNMTYAFAKANSLQHQSTFIKTVLLKEHPYDENIKIVADWAHFFECWYFHNCSYKAIDTNVSIYYMDGVSSVNFKYAEEERQQVLRLFFANKTIPKAKETRIERSEHITKTLSFKLRMAMRLKPLARDWKITRNGLKALWKDFFNLSTQ